MALPLLKHKEMHSISCDFVVLTAITSSECKIIRIITTLTAITSSESKIIRIITTSNLHIALLSGTQKRLTTKLKKNMLVLELKRVTLAELKSLLEAGVCYIG